jgi:colicin import membrane protein
MSVALQARVQPYAWSLLLHAGIVLLLVGGTYFTAREVIQPMPIQAVVMDQAILEAARAARSDRNRLRQDEELRRRAAAERQQAAEAERQQKVEAEQAARRERTEQAERARREQQLRADDAAKREAQAAEAKRRAEDEARRKAETAARERAQAEQRQAAQQAKERAAREADLKARIAEEERRTAAVAGGMKSQYVGLIQERVERNWIRPPSARAGLRCTVNVAQVPGGEVVSVRLGACNGDEAVKQSIVNAVFKSSPLPPPPDPTLFERNLVLEFVPVE